MTPVAVLVYVPDVEVGLQWYQQAFPEAVQMHLPDFDFTVLDVNGFSIEIVQSDDKVSEGKKGTVLYWSVRDLSVEISRFEALGATLYSWSYGDRKWTLYVPTRRSFWKLNRSTWGNHITKRLRQIRNARHFWFALILVFTAQ